MENKKEPQTQKLVAKARLDFLAKTARVLTEKAPIADKMPNSFKIKTSGFGYANILPSNERIEERNWIKTEPAEKPKASESNIINSKKSLFLLKIALPLSS